jgi:hypothetical protein
MAPEALTGAAGAPDGLAGVPEAGAGAGLDEVAAAGAAAGAGADCPTANAASTNAIDASKAMIADVFMMVTLMLVAGAALRSFSEAG